MQFIAVVHISALHLFPGRSLKKLEERYWLFAVRKCFSSSIYHVKTEEKQHICYISRFCSQVWLANNNFVLLSHNRLRFAFIFLFFNWNYKSSRVQRLILYQLRSSKDKSFPLKGIIKLSGLNQASLNTESDFTNNTVKGNSSESVKL